MFPPYLKEVGHSLIWYIAWMFERSGAKYGELPSDYRSNNYQDHLFTDYDLGITTLYGHFKNQIVNGFDYWDAFSFSLATVATSSSELSPIGTTVKLLTALQTIFGICLIGAFGALIEKVFDR